MARIFFAFAHPDDEWLDACVAIAEHVAAGHEVHVVWLTGGDASGTINEINGIGVDPWWGVQHRPTEEGYALLTPVTLAETRIAEASVAVRTLTAGLGVPVELHPLGHPDGQLTVPIVRDALLELVNTVAPGESIRLKGHTWVPQLDEHTDHIAVGTAIKQLGDEDEDRFGDRRHYVAPNHWTDADLSLINPVWDTPSNADIRKRVIASAKAFAAWHPPHSYAVGRHSVSGLFDTVLSNPRSLFHA